MTKRSSRLRWKLPIFRHQDVVFHSPILATTGDGVRGHPIVAKILETAFACYGMPRNVEDFQNPDGR